MKEIVGAIFVGLAMLNVWLWINLWNLKKELAQQTAQDSTCESTEQTTFEVGGEHIGHKGKTADVCERGL